MHAGHTSRHKERSKRSWRPFGWNLISKEREARIARGDGLEGRRGSVAHRGDTRMFPSNWSDGRVEQLKSLWQEGLSASQIANTMGNVTRNAVLGKLHRLGLLAKSKEVRRARPNSSVPRCPRSRSSKVSRPALIAEPDPFTFEDGNFVTLETVNDRMCRWPIGDPETGDFHFCGHARKAGSCYCDAHMQRAHQPGPAKRRRRTHRVAIGGGW
jgi:GcrA cell cycle regulator